YPADQQVWLLGSSLCYTKRLWAGNRFAEIDVGMDAHFVWGTPPEKVTVSPDSSFAVHMIHASNASPKHTEGAYWHHCEVDRIRSLIGADWAFYQSDKADLAERATVSVKGLQTVASAKIPTAPSLRNVFACLVHESRECVVDLVRNLRYHNPDSI